MAKISNSTDLEGNSIYNVELEENESQISLATANTYVDKNIIFNVDNKQNNAPYVVLTQEEYDALSEEEKMSDNIYLITDGDNALLNVNIANSLDVEEEGYTLDARQGKVLKDMIEEKTSSSSEKPNWSENDETSPSYIQNRTHWVETNEPTIKEFKSDITHWIPADSYYSSLGGYSVSFNPEKVPCPNMTDKDNIIEAYIIIDNGTRYNFTEIRPLYLGGSTEAYYIGPKEYSYGQHSVALSWIPNYRTVMLTSDYPILNTFEFYIKTGTPMTAVYHKLPLDYIDGYNTKINSEAHNDITNNTASGEYAFAEGKHTSATGPSSHAEGKDVTATGDSSHAEGYSTTASGSYSHAEGSETIASNEGSHAEGSNTTASNDCAHAEGGGTTASGICAHAEGSGTKALNSYAHAEGGGSTASGVQAHAEGAGTTASGTGAHAEGGGAKALGSYAHAEGNGTTVAVSGTAAHAEGSDTTASGSYSHVEGSGTSASNEGAHAEGGGSQASGSYSHAEGIATKAKHSGAHSEGSWTEAKAPYSHAEGEYTLASSTSQHVEGKYNIEDTAGTYAHIVGNGTYSNRSNAYTLDWNGNAQFAGDIIIDAFGDNPISLRELATRLASYLN